MIEHMMAHFKEWIAHTLAPFYIQRQETGILWPHTNNEHDEYVVLDSEAAPCGETKARNVNQIDILGYCCPNFKIEDRNCLCGRPDAGLQDYSGSICTEECDANGVETEQSFLDRHNAKLSQNEREEWKKLFRPQTAAEAYISFYRYHMRGYRLADRCERVQLATSLKALTVEICRANPDSYEHLSALLTLSPTSSYSRAETLQFRKAARSLKQIIDLHYAYEGVGGQQAAANFHEVAAQSAYYKAKLENAAENTQAANELAQAAWTIAKTTNAMNETVIEMARGSENVTDEMAGLRSVLSELSSVVQEMPHTSLIDIECGLEDLATSIDGASKQLGSVVSRIDDFCDKFPEQPRKKSRTALQ